MRKILFLSLACLMALCAMAQIDAIRVTQGETTDWYPFGKSDRIDVTITDGNPVIEGKTYDLTEGNVETAFGTDPFPAIKEAAIAEINNVAATAKEEINELGVDENVKNDAKAEIDNIAHTAEQTINAATSKDAIDNAKTEAIAKIYNVVQTTKNMWISVRENLTIGNYGTLCWKYDLTAIDGAELYTIAGIENGRIVLEEVLANETQAGAGYVIRATAKSLRVKNGDLYTDTPLPADECNGLQGTFEQIVEYTAGNPGNKLEGNYIIYQNEWRKCGVMVGLYANSAYLIMKYVPGTTPAPAPGRRYISMPLPNSTPTGLEQSTIHYSPSGAQSTIKVLRDGQFRIVKDNKMFNAQGQMLQ